MAGQEPVIWHAGTTVAERAVLGGYEASLAPTGHADRTDWWIYPVGGNRPVDEDTATTYAQAKRHAETALRYLAGQEGRQP